MYKKGLENSQVHLLVDGVLIDTEYSIAEFSQLVCNHLAHYDGTVDAEKVLEHDLYRRNWGVTLRDDIKARFERAVTKMMHVNPVPIARRVVESVIDRKKNYVPKLEN